MSISDLILYHIAKRYPSPMASQQREFGSTPGSPDYHASYALKLFKDRIVRGIGVDVLEKDVLEIGCGHGGITCFLAAVGTAKVVGIDLNEGNLSYGRQLLSDLRKKGVVGHNADVHFSVQDAAQTDFESSAFDIVYAPNVFEHFMDPHGVMLEAYRLLRNKGKLVVPIFSSIYCKYGLHLKHGLKVPWANLFFSEQTIIRALRRLATHDPTLYQLYPGLRGTPQRVFELRKHKDLNDITYGKFVTMANDTGFTVASFDVHATITGKLIKRIPVLRKTLLREVFSKGASSVLLKP